MKISNMIIPVFTGVASFVGVANTSLPAQADSLADRVGLQNNTTQHFYNGGSQTSFRVSCKGPLADSFTCKVDASNAQTLMNYSFSLGFRQDGNQISAKMISPAELRPYDRDEYRDWGRAALSTAKPFTWSKNAPLAVLRKCFDKTDTPQEMVVQGDVKEMAMRSDGSHVTLGSYLPISDGLGFHTFDVYDDEKTSKVISSLTVVLNLNGQKVEVDAGRVQRQLDNGDRDNMVPLNQRAAKYKTGDFCREPAVAPRPN